MADQVKQVEEQGEVKAEVQAEVQEEVQEEKRKKVKKKGRTTVQEGKTEHSRPRHRDQDDEEEFRYHRVR